MRLKVTYDRFIGSFTSGCGAVWLARLNGVQEVAGSSPATPTIKPASTQHKVLTNLLIKFLESRRQGLSPRTFEFYRYTIEPYLQYCNGEITPQTINSFLANLDCSTGGKHAYYRGIGVFINFLVRHDYLQDNPLKKVDAPKPPKPILPSLTPEQVQYVIDKAECLRDRSIISLLADSGMRLKEVSNIKYYDIDWENCLITVWGKGNKQRKAPFTQRTKNLLQEWLSKFDYNPHIWDINYSGIQTMLKRLTKKTGLPCNPHTFRRTFASNLHRKGLDVEHIMRLGGWESLDIVLRYTRSVKFEDSLKLYQAVA